MGCLNWIVTIARKLLSSHIELHWVFLNSISMWAFNPQQIGMFLKVATEKNTELYCCPWSLFKSATVSYIFAANKKNHLAEVLGTITINSITVRIWFFCLHVIEPNSVSKCSNPASDRSIQSMHHFSYKWVRLWTSV